MAVSGNLLTYLASGNKPEVSDIVDLIAYTETPSLSLWPKQAVNQTTIQWYDHDLTAASASNTNLEGADAGTASNLTRTVDSNVTQILDKVIRVSRTQRKIAKYGNIGDELTWQQSQKLKELARDLDITLMQGTYAAGDSVTARSMRGAEAAITTNANSDGGSLTEDNFRDNLLKDVWDAGGRTDKTVYCNSFQKNKIDGFTGVSNLRVNISPSNGVVSLPYNVGMYASSFGNVRVMLTPHATSTVVSAITDGTFQVGVFDAFTAVPLAKTGDSDKVQIIGEYTLRHRMEEFAGKMTGLAIT